MEPGWAWSAPACRWRRIPRWRWPARRQPPSLELNLLAQCRPPAHHDAAWARRSPGPPPPRRRLPPRLLPPLGPAEPLSGRHQDVLDPLVTQVREPELERVLARRLGQFVGEGLPREVVGRGCKAPLCPACFAAPDFRGSSDIQPLASACHYDARCQQNLVHRRQTRLLPPSDSEIRLDTLADEM